VQQHNPDGPVECRGHHGVVDDVGKSIEYPALPKADISLTVVPCGAEQPVVLRVLVLEDEALAPNHHPLETSTRFRVVRLPRCSFLGAVEEVRQGGTGRPGRAGVTHPPRPPSPP